MNDKGSRMGKFAMVEAVLEREELTATQDHVLRVLWMRFSGRLNEQGEAVCYPSAKTIAERCRLSQKTVERTLRKLTKLGLVSEPKMDGNRPIRTLYLNRASDIECQDFGHWVPTSRTLSTQTSDIVSQPSDIESPPIRKNRIEPSIEPSSTHAGARSWQGIMLPDGVVLTDADNPPVNDLARHIREHYPDTRKVEDRMRPNEIVRRAAPHIVSLVETHGTIADACDAGKRAVDAVAAIKRADPDAKPYGLKRWLSEGGIKYADPTEFMAYLKPLSSPKSKATQRDERTVPYDTSWLNAG